MTDHQSGWAMPGDVPPATPPGWSGPPGTRPPPPAGWGMPQSGPQGGPPPSAPKPGVIPLRPLSVGEVLDGAVSYLRANPAVTLGLSAVVIALTQLVQVPAQYLYSGSLAQLNETDDASVSEIANAFGGSLAVTLLGIVINFVGVTLLTGMLIVVLSRAVLGWRTSLAEAWTAARPRLAGLLGLSLLSTLLLVAALTLGIVPLLVALAAGAPPWAAAVLGLLGIPAGLGLMVYLWVGLALAPPAYILERTGVVAALSRSRRLTGQGWWRVFGILLLGTLIAAVISGIIGIPFGIAAASIDGAFTPDATVFAPSSLAALLVTALGTILASTITAPFVAGVTGLLYFDQRIRREAWDLELARAAYDRPGEPGPALDPGW